MRAGDRIELRGLRALGIIGVLPEERERAQPFELDIDLEADLHPAGHSDDLADTIDYGRAVALAERVVTTEQHLLLERVAQRVADELLALDGVDGRPGDHPQAAPAGAPGRGHVGGHDRPPAPTR